MIKLMYFFLIVLGACETRRPCAKEICTIETAEVWHSMDDETFPQPVKVCACVDGRDGGDDVGK